MNVLDFYIRKREHRKISMVTCYDYTSARILAQTSVDALLVGDSVAMMMHGHKTTLAATIEMMCSHTEAVARGAGEKFIVSDLPFLSYRKSLSKNVAAVQALMQAGAQAIKLENVIGNLKLIRHLVDSGIPVMGHLGLTMQFINMLGGCKVQGRTEESKNRIKQDALLLEKAGCFALVLECIPNDLAMDITQSLSIPTIGIGAGAKTDGQILVLQDLLGLNTEFKPKFVKAFINGDEQFKKGIEQYVQEIQSGEFPYHEHSYAN